MYLYWIIKTVNSMILFNCPSVSVHLINYIQLRTTLTELADINTLLSSL
jgi:hypothetical protein